MKTSFRSAAAMSAAALLMTACGGGESESAPSGGGGEDGELATLTVADTNGAPLYFLTYAQQEGFCEDAGVELDITASSGGATVIPQLVSGDLDVAGSNVVSVLIGASQGLPLRMIAGGTSTSEETEQDFSALMVAPDSTVTDISQLEGQRVAVNTLRNINDIVLGAMLEEAGLSYDSVEFVELPFPDMAAAVESGDVAAALLIEPFVSLAEESGLKIIGRPYSALKPGLQIGTYVVSEQFAQENPDAVEAFQECVQAAADSIREDPDAFRAALPEIGDLAPELAEKVRINLWQGGSDEESLELVQDLMVEYGLIEEPVDLDEVVIG
ncbi:ABC transporter substrate-binding protein [Blastococcus brunescens]|uniref:ABC transporter substrate-binding protein n=1 Tax=Blastococcus brunescens TaxID=1564165 RepID=A0ABZ1B769_9ACTN|nr:ABC transporter substrate-binding protein [Blastococcus sp. BMG 8361]WRL65708.1 ABC transporter substrate-binding protein [Blastococcus sp. BMG 8361]